MSIIRTGVITADEISISSDAPGLSLTTSRVSNSTQEISTLTQPWSDTDRFFINDQRPITISDSSFTPYNSINKGDLVFLEMKIENKNYMLVTMIYIDKKNYQEVKKTFTCDLSYSEEHRFYIGNNSSIPNMIIELKNIPEITEERIDL